MRAKVIVSSLLLIILTIIVAIITVIYKDIREEKKVKTIVNSFKVDLTSIIKMNNHKITDDYTTFFNNELISYECIIDSTYQLSMTRVGSLKTIGDKFSVSFTNEFIKAKHYHRMRTTTLSPICYAPYFDPYVIPYENIESIEIFLKGKIFNNQIIKRKGLFVCPIQVDDIIFSFNNHKSQDLYYINENFKNSIANLFFYLDTNYIYRIM